MSDDTFSFMSCKINFRDDPKFVHLDETLRILAYIFTHHIDIWIKLTKKLTSNTFNNVYNEQNQVDAGKVYNTLMLTQPFDMIGKSDMELSNAEYEAVVNTFYTCVQANKRLSFHAKNIVDPSECMWELCHYFFIPVRLQHSSLPKNVQANSLRKWLNLIYTLPFIPQYSRKFESAIPSITLLEQVYYKLSADPKRISQITSIEPDWIYQGITRSQLVKNPTRDFVRLFINVSLLCSVEILKKYCPNYRACAAINPDFDGSWLNPFDQFHTDHLQELNKLTMLLSVEHE